MVQHESRLLPDTMMVSLHTAPNASGGVQLYQFLGHELISVSWTRESNEVSRCELTVPNTSDYTRLPDVTPWIHWVSVWDDTGRTLYWTGPIQRTVVTRKTLVISARDVMALMSRTRCPITKRWEVEWPVDIAEELVQHMIELHGINTKAVIQPIHPLQYDERYDFAVKNDGTMLSQTFEDLSRLGLRWTVISGTPVLGPMTRTPIAALSENDFVSEGLEVVRDGSATYNDVLLRGADNLAQASVEMAGLHLQTTVTIDDMFGVSNVDRATKQYVNYASRIRDTVTIPDNSMLHPSAPISLDMMIPSVRITIDAYGMLLPMELTGVDVSLSSTASSVAIRMTSVADDIPELLAIQQRESISGGTA